MPIRVARWIQDRPTLWPYLFLALSFFTALALVNNVAKDSKDYAKTNRKDTCLTALEQNAKLLNITTPFSASPTNKEYFNFLVKQFHFPPAVCKGTGIHTEKELVRIQKGLPTFTIPTTTTTAPGTPGPPGQPGPAGPQGRQGPPGRTSSGGSSQTTTTTAPSTTSTTRCNTVKVDSTICR